jgi:protein tyrosine phosphatase
VSQVDKTTRSTQRRETSKLDSAASALGSLPVHTDRTKLLSIVIAQVNQACRDHECPVFPTRVEQIPAFCDALTDELFAVLDQLLTVESNRAFHDLVRHHHGIHGRADADRPTRISQAEVLRFTNISPYNSRALPPIYGVGSYMNAEQTVGAIEWPLARQSCFYWFQEEVVRSNVRLIVAIGLPSSADETEPYWTQFKATEMTLLEEKTRRENKLARLSLKKASGADLTTAAAGASVMRGVQEHKKREELPSAVIVRELLIPQVSSLPLGGSKSSSAPLPDHALTHVQLAQWPDLGTPELDLQDSLTMFVRAFTRLRLSLSDPLLVNQTPRRIPAKAWVHCRAGVGRTGTLLFMISIYDRLVALSQERSFTSSAAVDFLGMWIDLRVHRMRMVQTREQLRFALVWAMDEWLSMFQLPPSPCSKQALKEQKISQKYKRQDSGRSLFGNNDKAAASTEVSADELQSVVFH